MTRSVIAGALVQPVWEARGVRVEGPDEDAFTLAVAAIERLGLPPAELAKLDRIDLVGEFPNDVEWGLAEALGVETIDVHRHHGGVPSFFQALAAASSANSDPGSSSLLVAVDIVASSLERGAPQAASAAVALRLASGAGARFIGHTSRNHPAERRPDASAWVRQAHKAAPDVAATQSGLLGVIAEAPPPVLLAEWKRAYPSIRPVVRPWELSERGQLPSVRGALALQEHLGSSAIGDPVFIAAIRRERTDFVALRSEGPVEWVGEWGGLGPSLPAQNDRPFALEVDAGQVSEGAYVPRPRYVENLPSRWRFVAEACEACGRTTFPARGYCRHCQETSKLRRIELPRNDLRVEAVTTVAPGAQPTEFDGQVSATGAYAVVLVELGRGVRATLQVTDSGSSPPVVGSHVATRLRRLYPMEGAWRYGRKAVPVPNG